MSSNTNSDQVLTAYLREPALLAKCARLKRELEQAAAALAVVANHAQRGYLDLNDADNLKAIEAFALRTFKTARAALGHKQHPNA